MMHVHFHLDRQREHRRELDRKLELNRLHAEARAVRRPTPKPALLGVDGEIVPAPELETKRVLTDPFRKTARVTRLLAVHAKGVLANRAA